VLVDGTVTEAVFEDHEGRPRPERTVEIRREAPHVRIDGTRVLVTWHSPNPDVAHPFFECPVCSQRCRQFIFATDCVQALPPA